MFQLEFNENIGDHMIDEPQHAECVSCDLCGKRTPVEVAMELPNPDWCYDHNEQEGLIK
jgi:hypothetical protein